MTDSEKFNILRGLLIADRSIRRFRQERPVGREMLEKIVGLTRYCASGRNIQALKYRLVTDPGELGQVFPHLAWAGYYKDWDGPAESERPTAYIVQYLDTSLTENCLCDDGLQLQAITLGAAAEGIGACIIKSFNAAAIAAALGLPAHLRPIYVVALGEAAEEAKIVEMGAGGDYKYYRDSHDTQCVPKRGMDEIVIKNV